MPLLAGRSGIFLVRQLMVTKSGTRTGTWTVMHDQFNAQLTMPNIIALAAYAASREP